MGLGSVVEYLRWRCLARLGSSGTTIMSQAKPQEVRTVAQATGQLDVAELQGAITGLLLQVRNPKDIPFDSPSEALDFIKRLAASIYIPGEDSAVWSFQLRKAAVKVFKHIDSRVKPPFYGYPPDAVETLNDCLDDLPALDVAAEVFPPASGPDKSKPNGKLKKATTNALMIEEIQKDISAMGWNCTQWSKKIRRSGPSIVGTEVWQHCQMAREKKQAELARDRQRRPRHHGNSD